jgi:hypothetical protein
LKIGLWTDDYRFAIISQKKIKVITPKLKMLRINTDPTECYEVILSKH